MLSVRTGVLLFKKTIGTGSGNGSPVSKLASTHVRIMNHVPRCTGLATNHELQLGKFARPGAAAAVAIVIAKPDGRIGKGSRRD